MRVFENRVLRNIFGPKRNDVTGLWIKLQKQELDDLRSSPNIILVIKSRRLPWTGHVACMGDMRGAYVIVERIILKCIFKKWDVAWSGFIWLRTGTGGGLL